MAAKRTSDLIPLCHQINLSSVDVGFELERVEEGSASAGGWVNVRATAECTGGTGVEVHRVVTPFRSLFPRGLLTFASAPVGDNSDRWRP
jgi:hypothetical protein